MFKQIPEYFESFLSKYQRRFSKGFSTQQCFLSMLEKLKHVIDNEKLFGGTLKTL